jgi:hypothetical protein
MTAVRGINSGCEKADRARRFLALAAAFGCLSLLAPACANRPPLASSPAFEVVDDGRGGSMDAHVPVARRGKTLDCIVLRAPVTVRYKPGLAPLTLVCQVTPVFNVGDGVRLDVVRVEASSEQVVYSRYFDAGRRAQDRDWVPLSVPVGPCRFRGCGLELRASAGPQGDLTADWLALADIRIAEGSQDSGK